MKLLRLIVGWPLITIGLLLLRLAWWIAIRLDDPEAVRNAASLRRRFYEARAEMFR